MKKLFLLAVISLIGLSAHAQVGYQVTPFGLPDNQPTNTQVSQPQIQWYVTIASTLDGRGKIKVKYQVTITNEVCTYCQAYYWDGYNWVSVTIQSN